MNEPATMHATRNLVIGFQATCYLEQKWVSTPAEYRFTSRWRISASSCSPQIREVPHVEATVNYLQKRDLG